MVLTLHKLIMSDYSRDKVSAIPSLCQGVYLVLLEVLLRRSPAGRGCRRLALVVQAAYGCLATANIRNQSTP